MPVILQSSVSGMRSVKVHTTDPVAEFAHVLEQLETQFYTQALQKFQPADFVAAGFSDPTVPVQQFAAIQSDEATHTTVLEVSIDVFARNHCSSMS